MASDSVIDRVRKALAQTQRVPIETITPATTFEQLGMDSLDATNLLFALEDEFDVSIEDQAAKDFRSVQEVADAIEKLLSERPQDSANAGGS